MKCLSRSAFLSGAVRADDAVDVKTNTATGSDRLRTTADSTANCEQGVGDSAHSAFLVFCSRVFAGVVAAGLSESNVRSGRDGEMTNGLPRSFATLGYSAALQVLLLSGLLP